MRNMLTSAVALFTATGVLDTAMPFHALGKLLGSLVEARRKGRTSVRHNGNIDIVVSRAIMHNILDRLGQSRD